VPNIELHGFDFRAGCHLKNRIMACLKDKPYEPEYVISFCRCDVTDSKDHAQPFIRLVTTEQPHNAELIEILTGLGHDVEYAPLIAFYPKK